MLGCRGHEQGASGTFFHSQVCIAVPKPDLSAAQEAIYCKPCLLSVPVTRAVSHSKKHLEGRLSAASILLKGTPRGSCMGLQHPKCLHYGMHREKK